MKKYFDLVLIFYKKYVFYFWQFFHTKTFLHI